MKIIKRELNNNISVVLIDGVETNQKEIDYIEYFKKGIDVSIIDLSDCDGSMGGYLSDSIVKYLFNHPRHTEKVIEWVETVSSHPKKVIIRILSDFAWAYLLLGERVEW